MWKFEVLVAKNGGGGCGGGGGRFQSKIRLGHFKLLSLSWSEESKSGFWILSLCCKSYSSGRGLKILSIVGASGKKLRSFLFLLSGPGGPGGNKSCPQLLLLSSLLFFLFSLLFLSLAVYQVFFASQILCLGDLTRIWYI